MRETIAEEDDDSESNKAKTDDEDKENISSGGLKIDPEDTVYEPLPLTEMGFR